MKVLRFGPAILVAACLVGGTATVARAQTIKDFQGDYRGTAVTMVRQLETLGNVRNRDLDVSIRAADDGSFTLTWKTEIRNRWAGAVARTRTTTVKFVPAGKPNTWKAETSGAVIDGKPAIWAYLEKRALYVQIAAMTAGGGLATSSYKRTLRKDGLQLDFRSTFNGNRTRAVVGFLKRQSAKKDMKKK